MIGALMIVGSALSYVASKSKTTEKSKRKESISLSVKEVMS
jgi:hypothetical protein